MNAREAMQALLDGKVLRRGRVTTILTVWGLLIKVDNGTYEEIILEDCEVVEEYPLTFEEALRAMLDGKVVKPEGYDDAYRFRGEFQFSVYADESKDVWDILEEFEDCVQRGKWKVVE